MSEREKIDNAKRRGRRAYYDGIPIEANPDACPRLPYGLARGMGILSPGHGDERLAEQKEGS